MLKPLTHYLKAMAAVWELAFPKPNEITWLEKEALAAHKSRKAHIAKAPEDAELIGFITEIYARDGKKPPKIIIYEASQPNAMHLNNNTICISTAKLEKGDWQGLESTICHEYGHDKQNTLSLAITLSRGAAILAGATALTNKLVPKLEKTKAFTSIAVTATFAAISTALHYATELPWKAYRRWQEKDADACAVKLTGSAEGMIKNIEGHAQRKAERDAAKGITEPEGFKKIWRDLTVEHPSHEERIANVRAEEAKLKGKAIKV